MPSTVILGSGIIGLSTAYYLSQLTEIDADATPTLSNASPQSGAGGGTTASNPPIKHEIHLVEPSPELFASASGKAAGFLAKDWFAPAVAPLGEFSFDLHRKLAEEHGGKQKWGWSESVSYSLDREDGGESASAEDEDEDEEGEEGEGEEGEDEADPSSESARRRRKRTRNDLDWLMSGSSRATLLGDQGGEATDGGDEDHPRWVRAKRSAMQPISERATTGQV